MTSLYYSVGDSARRYRLAPLCVPVPKTWANGKSKALAKLAIRCAEDYYDHGGWDKEWPVQIRLYLYEDGGPPICTFDVDLEYEPFFDATPAKVTP